MELKTEDQLDKEANAATAYLSAGVSQLLVDGVEPASLVAALASALGVMLAAAPRDMADRLEVSVLATIREQRTATWAAVDAAEQVH